MGVRGYPTGNSRGISPRLLVLFGPLILGILIHLLTRAPKRRSTPEVETEPQRRSRPAPRSARQIRSTRRLSSVVRTAAFLIVCGVLAGVPFALSAYADVEPVVATDLSPGVPTEESEPLPPSYELAGLFESTPIDSTQIVWDASAFRSSSRKLRATQQTRPGEYVLPVDRSLVTAADLSSPHHDYPAVDLSVPTGSDVYAAHAGTVRTVTQHGRCGRGVVIAGTDGFSYIYCHGSEVLVQADQDVEAGERIMFSGNTGHSTGPHLHFGVETSDGTRICPQSLLASWYAGGDASPDGVGSTECFYDSPEKARKRKEHDGASGPSSGDPVERGSGSGSDGDGGESYPTPIPRPKPSLPVPSPTPAPVPSPEPTSTESIDTSAA